MTKIRACRVAERIKSAELAGESSARDKRPGARIEFQRHVGDGEATTTGLSGIEETSQEGVT